MGAQTDSSAAAASTTRLVSSSGGEGLELLTITSPDLRNRWSPAASADLAAAADRLEKTPAIRVLVITGAGDEYFSAGSFDPALRRSSPKEQTVQFVLSNARLRDRLGQLPQITIAALNGQAIGSGVELSLACDLRLISDKAGIRFPEIDMGGFPGGGGTARLPEVIGRAAAMDLICTGRAVHADELLRLGFCQRVFPAATFMQDVLSYATLIASKAGHALRGAKEITWARTRPGFAEARMLSDQRRAELEWHPDTDEAILAAIEGRKPVFRS